jgi:hypothetical protein
MVSKALMGFLYRIGAGMTTQEEQSSITGSGTQTPHKASDDKLRNVVRGAKDLSSLSRSVVVSDGFSPFSLLPPPSSLPFC